MRWTIKQVVDAVAGKSQGGGIDSLARVAGVSIDSRTLRRGELFIAIHGPRKRWGTPLTWRDPRNGRRGRSGRGTCGIALSRSMQDRCITVPDTLEALHNLARAVRKDWGKKICGITGSVGKTTTKEILAALLGSKLRVLKVRRQFQ